MKAMEGPQERLRTELSDKKRGTTDKTVYNETELMVKTLRGGGEASLRYSQIIVFLIYLKKSAALKPNVRKVNFYRGKVTCTVTAFIDINWYL
jgi:hypothetical protein